MNFLKQGPEIKMPKKMPEFKLPGPISDLYQELRERHLLPLVVVLIAGIVAVPIALSESGHTGPSGEAAVPSTLPAKPAALVVSKSIPGLRDYRKRLKGLRATNPFKQRFVAAEEAGATTTESGGGSAGGAGSEEGTGSGESTPAPEGGGGGGTTVTHELKYFSWTIDVRIVPVSSNGKPSTAKPTVRYNQPELTMLPGRQTPAAIFMGPTSDGKKALLLVSSNVTAVFGEATCVLGGETCEMVALEPGAPETFVYGANQRIFRLELKKIQLVETNKLNRAPLGEPKSGNRPQPHAQSQAAVNQAVRQPR